MSLHSRRDLHKPSHSLRLQRRMNPEAGVTIPQLLVTAVVIVILSTITISNSLATWRSSQAGELAQRLAGWLEEVSRAPEVIGKSCRVTISTGTLGINAVLARAEVVNGNGTERCSSDPTLRLTTSYGSNSVAVGATSTSIVFTPRQAITSTSDIQVRLAIANQAPVRCVRLSAVLGLIRVGRNDGTSSVGTDCPATSFDSI